MKKEIELLTPERFISTLKLMGASDSMITTGERLIESYVISRDNVSQIGLLIAASILRQGKKQENISQSIMDKLSNEKVIININFTGVEHVITISNIKDETYAQIKDSRKDDRSTDKKTHIFT